MQLRLISFISCLFFFLKFLWESDEPVSGQIRSEERARGDIGHEWPLAAQITIAGALFITRSFFFFFWGMTAREKWGLCTNTSLQLGSEILFLEWTIGFSPC